MQQFRKLDGPKEMVNMASFERTPEGHPQEVKRSPINVYTTSKQRFYFKNSLNLQ